MFFSLPGRALVVPPVPLGLVAEEPVPVVSGLTSEPVPLPVPVLSVPGEPVPDAPVPDVPVPVVLGPTPPPPWFMLSHPKANNSGINTDTKYFIETSISHKGKTMPLVAASLSP